MLSLREIADATRARVHAIVAIINNGDFATPVLDYAPWQI
jgi:hypothetical protein